MEGEKLQIKCPKCGLVITVLKQPGMEKKSLTCPACKVKSKLTEYHVVIPKAKPAQSDDTESTQYNLHTTKGSRTTGETTMYDDPYSGFRGMAMPGKLVDETTGAQYQLMTGTNTIGRKAAVPRATIQINTANHTMSRNHAIIQIKEFNNKLTHFISNSENKNHTYINGQLLDQGDRVVLQDGDLLKFGDFYMRFKL